MANMYMGEQALGTVAVVMTSTVEVTDDGNGNVTIATSGINISVDEN